MSRSHRKCGFCQSVVPVAETECPFCDKSLENHGALGRKLTDLLPQERPLTKILAGLAVAVFAMVGLLAGGTAIVSPSTYTLIHFGASFPPYIIEGQIWRLVTALFMHGDILHIAFNIYALWLLGPLIENSFGKSRYLIIFLVTGLISTLVSLGWGFVTVELARTTGLAWLSGGSFATPTVGMSGALTGLIGVGVTAGHRVKTEHGAQIRNTMLRWMVFIIIFGLVVPQVDNAAHVGGFLAGLALGALLPLKDRASLRAGYFYAAAAAICALIIVGSLVAQGVSVPRQYPPDSKLYPTGIFGQTIREGDQNDRDLSGAAKACEDAIAALEAPALDVDTRRKQTDIAVSNCDEFTYLLPVVGEGYLYSAHAHAHAGDHDFACRRLFTARLFNNYSLSGGKNIPFELRMARIADMAGCK